MDANEIKDEIQQKLEKTSKYMKGLFPIQQYANEEEEIINDCFERHDVPKVDHPRVRDLNDRHGDGLVNSNGFPTAGILVQEDFHVGGDSPVVPIVLGMAGFVFGLFQFLNNIHLQSVAMIVIALYALLAIKIKRLMFFDFKSFGLFTAIIILALLFGAYEFFTHMDTLMQAYAMHGSQASSIFSYFSFLSLLLPFWSMLIPYVYYKRTFGRYILELADVGTTHNGAIASNLRSQGAARSKQMAKALEDLTWFVKIGRATGKLSARGDSFAPDKGLDFGQTVQDQRQHGFYFGAPGTGKTTSLKNIMAGVIKDEIWKEELEFAVQMVPEIKGEKPKDRALRALALYEDEMRAEVEKRFREKIANYEDEKLLDDAEKEITTKETI
ncbi:hypothetical protein KGP84_22520 [Burkholderia multivorans]|uniref:hypothetical protein n=1 Tax=Burkholderia multivorans TaxID=87883 RepID=UPI00209E5851|nr:hypothetical protein [Burkholderia multivorans]MCO8552923.1 hypothetical protein [Burkholderia multivorans]